VTVVVDIAGAQMGGAARFAGELDRYLARTGRRDVQVIGGAKRVAPGWLMRRETVGLTAVRRIAVNNISFVAPTRERWALLRNALHFLTAAEADQLEPAERGRVRREAAIVRLAARRADIIVVPCSAMAERVSRIVPGVQRRLIVRPHPVSANSVTPRPRDPAILCPVLFSHYKRMDERLTELLDAIGDRPAVRVRVTADAGDLPPRLATDARVELLGRRDPGELRDWWARSRAIYFPTGLESFGYPLAEARVSGQPVIARETAQNAEIAGPALCGYELGDRDSLRHAVEQALTADVAPDPAPFDPDAYFAFVLGDPR
jgi:glycosyltransferase involved in cell wall biosynthesis